MVNIRNVCEDSPLLHPLSTLSLFAWVVGILPDSRDLSRRGSHSVRDKQIPRTPAPDSDTDETPSRGPLDTSVGGRRHSKTRLYQTGRKMAGTSLSIQRDSVQSTGLWTGVHKKPRECGRRVAASLCWPIGLGAVQQGLLALETAKRRYQSAGRLSTVFPRRWEPCVQRQIAREERCFAPGSCLW